VRVLGYYQGSEVLNHPTLVFNDVWKKFSTIKSLVVDSLILPAGIDFDNIEFKSTEDHDQLSQVLEMLLENSDEDVAKKVKGVEMQETIYFLPERLQPKKVPEKEKAKDNNGVHTVDKSKAKGGN
jgi:hypothetical protein